MKETRIAEKKAIFAERITERLDTHNGESALVLGYACVSSTKAPTYDIEAWSQTKAYKDLQMQLESRFIPPENIFIDMICGSSRNRPVMNLILDFSNRFFSTALFDSARFTLFLPSVSDLASTADAFRETYYSLTDKKIGLLFGDREDLNTVESVNNEGLENYQFDKSLIDGFSEVKRSPLHELFRPEYKQRLDALTDEDFKTRQGRKKTEISPEFVKIYWLYEHFLISEPVALANSISGKMNKRTFYQLCVDYEHSEAYKLDELHEIENHILEKPKRYGKAPEKLLSYLSLIQQGTMTREEACEEMGITPITFDRFILKGTDKKKTGAAIAKYKDEYLIYSIALAE